VTGLGVVAMWVFGFFRDAKGLPRKKNCIIRYKEEEDSGAFGERDRKQASHQSKRKKIAQTAGHS